jgi:hypothetical protein
MGLNGQHTAVVTAVLFQVEHLYLFVDLLQTRLKVAQVSLTPTLFNSSKQYNGLC